jgi:acetyltransferase-like isoleucine patch superfamily enzyme
VGSFVNICPGAVLAGEVTVEDDVFIGANATVIHGGITIGQGAIVGAGAVVIDNVPPGAVVAGVPARKIQ